MAASCKKCWYKPSLFADRECLAGQDPESCKMPKKMRDFMKKPYLESDWLFLGPEDKERCLKKCAKLLKEIYDGTT
jgi:hypothetical protein